MRKALVLTFAILWMVILFIPFFPLLFVWPTRRWRQNVSRIYSRIWSRASLWVAGIRVEVEGREHLKTLPAVFTFNHTSMVDFFVNASIAPPGALVFGKRELVRVPFMGWMWHFGAHPMIVRHDPEQWTKVLKSVEDGLASGRHCTLIAPEGTRSRDGKLLPFKKGPFRLAMASGAPIVPMVLKGMMDVYDPKRGFRPGTVTIKVLPPFPSDGWTAETLDEPIKAVRDAYLRELGEEESVSAESPGV